MMGPDGTLQVHLTRYLVEGPRCSEPDTLGCVHLMSVDPRVWKDFAPDIPQYSVEEPYLRAKTSAELERLAQSASVLVTHAVDQDQPPMLVLDSTIRRYPGAAAVGVIVDHNTCLVGLRTQFWAPPGTPESERDVGYTVTMSTVGEQPGPLTLYASALYGWAQWWVSNAQDLSSRERLLKDLPPPPLELELVEARVPYRVTLSDTERSSWPAPPPQPYVPRDDLDME
ncbi:hypothetical protein OG453_07220 [Streptomyces sp. NBC_01381]|uniref:hypothetical protein n=1 Tax=Streptomyces sp. NBC_01381 TaxID=2903845 RepID=UPI00224DDF7A|nr:hypothetical protein [Streptomyces sp. NBC_01381]MCX4666458.1 hypothetical protein [Streptomyces sp. NBC_01381]